jgi:hypothetical protein
MASFSSKNLEALKSLEAKLQNTNFSNIEINIDDKKKTLTFTGME